MQLLELYATSQLFLLLLSPVCGWHLILILSPTLLPVLTHSLEDDLFCLGTLCASYIMRHLPLLEAEPEIAKLLTLLESLV